MIKWCDSSKCHQITCKNVILLLLKLTLSPVNILQVMGATGAYNRASRIGMHVCCYSRSGGHNRSSFLVAYTVRNREYLQSRKQVLSYKEESIWPWIPKTCFLMTYAFSSPDVSDVGTLLKARALKVRLENGI